MPFRPEDIAVKQFLVRARGYDRDEVGAFLRAVAADYRQALDSLDAAMADLEMAPAADPAPIVPPEPTLRERLAATITERRAAELLEAASRRLEEAAAKERQLLVTEQRLAEQLEAARRALQAARVQVRTAAVLSGPAVARAPEALSA